MWECVGIETPARTKQMTETEFYKAVKVACDAQNIDSTGRGYVEMTCIDNAFDAPISEYWDRAHDTLVWFVATGDLIAASNNER